MGFLLPKLNFFSQKKKKKYLSLMKSFVGPGWDMGLKQTRDLSDGWAAGTEGSCRSWQAEVWVPA